MSSTSVTDPSLQEVETLSPREKFIQDGKAEPEAYHLWYSDTAGQGRVDETISSVKPATELFCDECWSEDYKWTTRGSPKRDYPKQSFVRAAILRAAALAGSSTQVSGPAPAKSLSITYKRYGLETWVSAQALARGLQGRSDSSALTQKLAGANPCMQEIEIDGQSRRFAVGLMTEKQRQDYYPNNETATSSSPVPVHEISCLITKLQNVGELPSVILGVAKEGNQTPGSTDVSGLSQGQEPSVLPSERIHFTKDQCTEISDGQTSFRIPTQATLGGVVIVLAREEGSTGDVDLSTAFTVMPWNKKEQPHTTAEKWVELTHDELISVFSSAQEPAQVDPSVKVLLSGQLTSDPDKVSPEHQGYFWHLDFQAEKTEQEAPSLASSQLTDRCR